MSRLPPCGLAHGAGAQRAVTPSDGPRARDTVRFSLRASGPIALDLLGLTSTLRKMLAYVESIFTRPGAASPTRRLGRRLARITWLAAAARWCLATPLGVAAHSIVRTFFWKDLSGDQIDPTTLEPEARPVLRLTLLHVIVSLAALLVVPTWLDWPLTLPKGELAVDAYPVLGLAWLVVAVPIAWGALLVGAARANPWALGAALVFATYLWISALAGSPTRLPTLALGVYPTLLVLLMRSDGDDGGADGRAWPHLGRATMALGAGMLFAMACVYLLRLRALPWWGATLVGAAAWACALAATALLRSSWRATAPRFVRWLLLAVAGRAALWVIYALLRIALEPPADSAGAECFFAAAVAALLAPHVGRWQTVSALRATGLIGAVLSLATLGYLVDAGPARATVAFAMHLDGVRNYAWLVFYFMGAGIAFKLLTDTKGLARPLDALLPGRWLPAITLTTLVAVTLWSWLPTLSDHLAVSQGSRFWLELSQGWREAVSGIVWRETLATWRYAALVIAGVLLYLFAMRRLDRGAALRWTFLTILCFLAILEYNAEYWAFGRPPKPRSAFAVFLFGVWIVWLAYSVSARSASSRSARFPAPARTALFGGGLALFGVGLLHHGLVRPERLADEYFLLMYQGAVFVGVPYFLYIYATRKLRHAMPGWPPLIGAFVLGFAARWATHVLEKLTLVDFDGAAFRALLQSVLDEGVATGRLPVEVAPAHDAQALVWMVALATALRGYLGSRLRAGVLGVAAIYLGFGAAGLVDFPELPFVSPLARVAIAPLERFLQVTPHMLMVHACAVLVAMVATWCALSPRRAWLRGWGGAALAGATELALLLLTRAWGDDLVAAELHDAALLLVVVAAIVLAYFARLRLDAPGADEGADDDAGAHARRVPRAHVVVACGLVLLGVAAYSVEPLLGCAPSVHDVSEQLRVVLPRRWAHTSKRAAQASRPPTQEAASTSARGPLATWRRPDRDGLAHLELWPNDAPAGVKDAAARCLSRLDARASARGFMRPQPSSSSSAGGAFVRTYSLWPAKHAAEPAARTVVLGASSHRCWMLDAPLALDVRHHEAEVRALLRRERTR